MIDLSENTHIKTICKRIKKEDIDAIDHLIMGQGQNIDWSIVESECREFIRDICSSYYYDTMARIRLLDQKSMRKNLLQYFKDKYK